MICKCYGCSELKKVTFQGKLPNNTINCGLQSTCFFFVPKAYYQDYKEALGSKYSYIHVPLNDETSDGTVILIKEEQPEKHPQPKNSTDDGTMKLTKEEQPDKQYSLNPNTDDGIVMFAKEEQL